MEIREIRKKAGLNQAEFSARFGIPLQTLRNWECRKESSAHRECPAYVKELLRRVVESEASKPF